MNKSDANSQEMNNDFESSKRAYESPRLMEEEVFNRVVASPPPGEEED